MSIWGQNASLIFNNNSGNASHVNKPFHLQSPLQHRFTQHLSVVDIISSILQKELRVKGKQCKLFRDNLRSLAERLSWTVITWKISLETTRKNGIWTYSKNHKEICVMLFFPKTSWGHIPITSSSNMRKRGIFFNWCKHQEFSCC